MRQEFNFHYIGTNIPYSIWFTKGTDHIDTIIFLGTVQIGRLPAWVAENCPPNTAVVQGAPHWYAKKDGSDIPDYMFGFTQAVLADIASIYTLKHIAIMADSQAVPAVLRVCSDNNFRLYIDKLVLLQPLGLNVSAYKGDDDFAITLFKKRIYKNGRHQLGALIADAHLRYNNAMIMKTVNLRSAKTRAQYTSGLLHDSSYDLGRVVRNGTPVYILCGSNDKIFPPAEIQENLHENNLDIAVQTVPGIPHSPLATKHGAKLLTAAFKILDS